MASTRAHTTHTRPTVIARSIRKICTNRGWRERPVETSPHSSPLSQHIALITAACWLAEKWENSAAEANRTGYVWLTVIGFGGTFAKSNSIHTTLGIRVTMCTTRSWRHKHNSLIHSLGTIPQIINKKLHAFFLLVGCLQFCWMNRNTQTTHCYIRFVRLCSNCRGVLCTPLSYGLVLQQSNQPRKIKMDTDDRIIFVLFVIRLYDWLASLVNYLSTSTTIILRHQSNCIQVDFMNEAFCSSNSTKQRAAATTTRKHTRKIQMQFTAWKKNRSFSHSRETSFDIFQFE